MIQIENAGPGQAETLSKLHATAFEAHEAWNAKAMFAVLELPSTTARLARIDGRPGGFVIVQQAVEQAEILTLAVDPAYRRRGLARQLVSDQIALLATTGVTRLILDVAVDNPAALALYTSLGFHQDGRRRAYYSRPGQARMDALLMSLAISGQNGPERA